MTNPMPMTARSDSRGTTRVRVLCVHTTEGGGTAQELRDATWWVGSSHALADGTGTLLTPAEGCVDYNRAAWTLRSGNPWSENIELVGYASWVTPIWMAQHLPLLDACARWLAARSVARGIPLVKLTPEQYAGGASGVIGHADHTVGYHDGTHWDPGPYFPWDYVLGLAKTYAGHAPAPTSEENFLMALTDAQQNEALSILRELRTVNPPFVGVPTPLAAAIGDIFVHARTAAAGDPKAAATALAPLVIAALGDRTSITKADVSAAVREVFASAAAPTAV